ncbi:MAG: glycosyltransferase family 4 protein [Verrucomicrobia bacterium]|nr:glycosyltransferase family 4 protein [Verrucomicrobiota bacterium]
MQELFSPTTVPRRIGFISTRFQGTDGVTLEADKWCRILTSQGNHCYWMAGLLDRPKESSFNYPLAFFNHPEIRDVQSRLFKVTTRSRPLTSRINALKEKLKDGIYQFIDKFQIEVIIPENILSIPMHVPLGLAMTEVIAETGMPTIAHHHDFTWERERFTLSAVNDYLQAAFPPSLPRIEHVVINSMGQKELARRFSLPATVIPNILDYETLPPGIDDYNEDVRSEIGLKDDDYFILQPTRVVARKGIEHAIDLVRRLKNPRAKLVISHPPGDEGNAYMQMLRDRIQDAQIDVRFIYDRISLKRGYDEQGRKMYTLFDIYPHADIVTYPSYYEGSAYAFLEAIYFRKPVVVNTYAVYARDIEPLGFKTIEMSNLVTNDVVEQTWELLNNLTLREEWAEINYSLALKYFSFAVARRRLATRLANLFGEGI